jgi:hypothetical protein
MLIRGMVRDEVEDHFDPAGMCLGDQPVEIHQAAEDRRHVTIVGDVVAEICHRRRVDGRDPQRIDPQPAKVVQAAAHSSQVSDPVRVAVLEGARVHLVEDPLLPPVRVGHESTPICLVLPHGFTALYTGWRTPDITTRLRLSRAVGAEARAYVVPAFGSVNAD